MQPHGTKTGVSAVSGPDFRVQELQRLAREHNTKLIAEFPNVNFASGGNPFLGKHYCQRMQFEDLSLQ
jgi:hypothetical protein